MSRALFALAAALGLTSAVLFIAAIWTVGSDSGRWAGTAGVAATAAFVLVLAAIFTSEGI